MTDRMELKQALQTNGRRTGIHAITLEREGSRERWAAPRLGLGRYQVGLKSMQMGRCRPSATLISTLLLVLSGPMTTHHLSSSIHLLFTWIGGVGHTDV